MDTTPYTLCGRSERMNWIACEWTQANQSWVCVRRFYFCLITINIFANVFICYGAYRCWGPLKGLLFDKSLDTFADSACAWFMRQAAKVSLVKSAAFQGSLPNAHQTNRRRRRRRNHIINFKHCQTRQLCNGEKWNFIACQQQQQRQRQPLHRLCCTHLRFGMSSLMTCRPVVRLFDWVPWPVSVQLNTVWAQCQLAGFATGRLKLL